MGGAAVLEAVMAGAVVRVVGWPVASFTTEEDVTIKLPSASDGSDGGDGDGDDCFSSECGCSADVVEVAVIEAF